MAHPGIKVDKAQKMVRELERVTPYMIEGLYGNFLRRFMDCEQIAMDKRSLHIFGQFQFRLPGIRR